MEYLGFFSVLLFYFACVAVLDFLFSLLKKRLFAHGRACVGHIVYAEQKLQRKGYHTVFVSYYSLYGIFSYGAVRLA